MRILDSRRHRKKKLRAVVVKPATEGMRGPRRRRRLRRGSRGVGKAQDPVVAVAVTVVSRGCVLGTSRGMEAHANRIDGTFLTGRHLDRQGSGAGMGHTAESIVFQPSVIRCLLPGHGDGTEGEGNKSLAYSVVGRREPR